MHLDFFEYNIFKKKTFTHTDVNLQNGEGNAQRFIIHGEETRNFRRFRYTGREIRGRIAPPPPEANVWEWIEGAIHDLHGIINGRCEPDAFIGVTVDSERFQHGPVWLSFRPVRNFNANDLVELLFNVAQSGNEYSAEDSLRVTCGIVDGVAGRGRVKLTSQDVNKKSILNIRNDDNLCLPRSLATAYAYAVRGQIRTGVLHDYWNRIRNETGRTQRTAAEELVRLADVSIGDEGCGLQDVDKFQTYWATRGTAVVVYAFNNFGKGNRPLYDGTNIVMSTYGCVEHTLRIMYYATSRHYQPILNLIGASGSNGYCIPCNKSYWRVADHRCSNKCRQCMRAPPCDIPTELLLHCNDCNRDFYNDVCYEHHTTKGSFDRNNSVCEKKKMCVSCFKIVYIDKKRKHVCGVTFCRICKQDAPVNHLCYMQPIPTAAPKSRIIYLFFDFEAQQVTSVLGDEEKKYTNRIYV